MNKTVLLEQLKLFTEMAVKDLVLPVAMQKGDTEQQYRPAEVYKMRLPDSGAAKKKCPYIIHQVVTGNDVQQNGQTRDSNAVVRSVFCVYDADEQQGALSLLNLMERFRIALLKQTVIGKQFVLDLSAGMEQMIYPDDTAPYFCGEIVSRWRIPRVEREVSFYG